jgi:hypothetical protein
VKQWRAILFGVVAVLLLASVVAWLLQSSAIDVARAKCLEVGWPAEKLRATGYHSRGNIFLGEQQRVDFAVEGTNPLRQFQVTLHRRAHFLGWRVIDCPEPDSEQ